MQKKENLDKQKKELVVAHNYNTSHMPAGKTLCTDQVT